MKHPQFTLDLNRPDDTSPSAFARAPANEAAVRLVETWPDWPGPVAAIVGPAHSGKTHLGEMWAARANAAVASLGNLASTDIAETTDAPLWLMHDDAEKFDEDALFHLINLAREDKRHVLITARDVPAKWMVALPDLASRLKALPVAEIGAPDEALLEAILVKRLTDKGVDPDPAMMRYLLARMDRTFEAAHLVAEALGRRTLAAQRRATVRLAAEVLEEIGTTE